MIDKLLKLIVFILLGYYLGVIILLIWSGLLSPDVKKPARTPDSTDSLKRNPPEGYGNFIIAGSDTVPNAKDTGSRIRTIPKNYVIEGLVKIGIGSSDHACTNCETYVVNGAAYIVRKGIYKDAKDFICKHPIITQ